MKFQSIYFNLLNHEIVYKITQFDRTLLIQYDRYLNVKYTNIYSSSYFTAPQQCDTQ